MYDICQGINQSSIDSESIVEQWHKGHINDIVLKKKITELNH